MISGFMAGVGGIMLASRLRSVATGTAVGTCSCSSSPPRSSAARASSGRRPRRLGAARGARDRLDPERHGPARPGVRHEVRHHRPRPAERGAGGRLLQTPPGRSRRRVTTGEGIGVGMLGYAFMGKAHSRAFREAKALHAPLAPELVSSPGARPTRSRPRRGSRLERGGHRLARAGRRRAHRPLRQRRPECPPRRADHRRRAQRQARPLREAARPHGGRVAGDLAGGRARGRGAHVRLQLPLRASRPSRARDGRGRRPR